MKKVLDCEFEFKIPPRTAREKEEYINLYVVQNGKKIDIGLQGSGFLQVAEIFSSMDIMDNALNVLLIDEPDSHISPRIQNKLLDCLKEISNVQVFVITHNDPFVEEFSPGNNQFVEAANIDSLDDYLAIFEKYDIEYVFLKYDKDTMILLESTGKWETIVIEKRAMLLKRIDI